MASRLRFNASWVGPKPDGTNTSREAVGFRLRLTREASGFSQGEFARLCRIGRTALSNYEAGRRRIAIPAALRIVKQTGVRLAWIYHGDRRFLPNVLSKRVVRLLREE